MQYINQYYQPIKMLCEQYKVAQMYAFGSVITNRFNDGSDIDLKIVMNDGLDPLEYGENVLQLWNNLEKLFNRPVDLLTDQSIKNPFLKNEIEKNQVKIYDRTSKKILVRYAESN